MTISAPAMVQSAPAAPPAAAASRAVFMPQLDVLRAFAVLAVFLHHLLDSDYLPEFLRLNWGFYGVRLFFVLSGFLITGILVRARDSAGEALPERMHAIRQFFVRRFLRIFPLYYLVIFTGLILGVEVFRENFWSLLTYTFNFKLVSQGWFPNSIAHLWSLAIEEQFYIFWPWVVLFVSKRRLPWWTFAMIVSAPLFRLVAMSTNMSPIGYYIATPACLDSLGIGAMLAVVSNGGPAPLHVRRALNRYVLPAAIIAAFAVKNLVFPGVKHVDVVVSDTLFAVMSCWLIAGASVGFSGPLSGVFRSRVLLYLGRIAYGLYVYHLLIEVPVHRAGRMLGLEWQRGEPLFFLIASILTVLIASLSWHHFERPINEFKKHFEYTRDAQGKHA